VEAGQEGAIFFVNQMHDLPGGVSPVSPMHVNELLQRPIVAGKIQCISTATPASHAKLLADQHWLGQHFEAVRVAPAGEQDALKVLLGIKNAYEQFHGVTYTDDAITSAVYYASRCIKNGYLPGKAVDLIDEAGACAQLHPGKLPEEVIEVQKRIRFIVQRMENSIANHKFEKARFYSGEEKKECEALRQLRQTHKLDQRPGLAVTRARMSRLSSPS